MSKILEKSFLAADYARQTFVARPPAGTALADVLDENYWAHVAKKVNPHDIIEVVPEDGSFYAKLLVTSRGGLWVRVHQIEYVDISGGEQSVKPAQKAADDFDVNWGGPNDKWRIVRKSDKMAVGKNFASREDADGWLEKHIKEIAA